VSGPGGWDGLGVSIAEVADRLAEQRRPPEGGVPYTLSGVLNLVAYAPRPEELDSMREVIEGLADRQASRTILIAEAGEGTGMDAMVSTSCRLAGDSTTLALELVVLTVHGETRAGTASACTPLLRSELPTVLWWPLPPDAAAGGSLAGLLSVADRVVTEAGRGEDAAAAVRALAAWIPGEDGPAVTDLAWAAITSWRQLIVQMLDRESLEALRRRADTSVVHAGAEPDAGALLLAGWLRDFIGAAGDVRLLPGGGPGSGVLAVEVAGPTGRRLRVERLAGREAAAVTVTEADGTAHHRTLPLPDPDRARLLAGELEIQRRDRAFERALARAPV
jgi:glucose-6-phosphate dehydrogenase assembly protein OpcA